jgi:hypothetical protein
LQGDINTGLGARLWKLAKYVRERVTEGRQSGTIVEISTPYVKATVRNFSYGDQGAISLGTSFEYVTRAEWQWRHQHTFAEETIHASAAFSDCLPGIAAESAGQAGAAQFQLSQFVGTLMSRSAASQTDEDLIELVTTFIADLHQAPMQIEVSAWVHGLWLSSPSVTASEVQLRRPDASDFEYERSFHLQIAGPTDPWQLGHPPAIALFQLRGTTTFDA